MRLNSAPFPLFFFPCLSSRLPISTPSVLLPSEMYAISYPVNNLLMGSGSQIIVLAEEEWADKGKPLAHESERQRAFDEQEAGDGQEESGEDVQGGTSRYQPGVTGSDLIWGLLMAGYAEIYNTYITVIFSSGARRSWWGRQSDAGGFSWCFW